MKRWLFLIVLASSAAYGSDLEQFQAGDAKRGWQVFQSKGCLSCHKIGEGSQYSIGPDLARLASSLSATDLAASMWNHAPQMWEKISEHALAYQPMGDQETVDLFSFMFFLRYIEEEGDPKRGETVLEAKLCTTCHSLSGKGGKAAPDITSWSQHVNPLSWLQKMWQHAPQMLGEMRKRGLTWPTFKGQEMVDLVAYVRGLGAKNERSYLKTGQPANGKVLLRGKGCSGCHSGAGPGPDFGRAYALPPTIGQLAASMWNHAPQMINLMSTQGIEPSPLTSNELADIVAYLFARRFIGASGSAENGEKIFENKGCTRCHTATGAKLPQASITKMAQGLWNHGPNMLEAMREQGIRWPNLSGRDLADLIAFFKARGDK